MRRLITNWRLLATILVVLAILAVALWPESVEVDVVRASRGSLQVTIDEEGETRVRERFVVSAPVAGRLQRIELEPGHPVRRGETVLARLTPAQPGLLDPRARAELGAAVEAARAALGQARAERERATASLERARSILRRQQGLGESGVISRDDLEAAETAVRTAEEALRAAEFNVTRTEFEVQTARARLQQPDAGGRTIELLSPIDGVVLKLLRESQSVVQSGEPLIEVGDPTDLEVVADLLSTDAVRVPAGARVLIEHWGGGRPLEGRVRLVEPSGFMKVSALGVEEQRVNVIIDFVDTAAATGAFDASSRASAPGAALGDGYRVEVRVVIRDEADVLKVPVGTLFRRGESWAVFVVHEGRARTQVIGIGQRNAAEAQVIEGLEPGEEVVLHPPDTLRDGVRVVERQSS
jgi:HlyD family secretion protein